MNYGSIHYVSWFAYLLYDPLPNVPPVRASRSKLECQEYQDSMHNLVHLSTPLQYLMSSSSYSREYRFRNSSVRYYQHRWHNRLCGSSEHPWNVGRFVFDMALRSLFPQRLVFFPLIRAVLLSAAGIRLYVFGCLCCLSCIYANMFRFINKHFFPPIPISLAWGLILTSHWHLQLLKRWTCTLALLHSVVLGTTNWTSILHSVTDKPILHQVSRVGDGRGCWCNCIWWIYCLTSTRHWLVLCSCTCGGYHNAQGAIQMPPFSHSHYREGQCWQDNHPWEGLWCGKGNKTHHHPGG